MPGELGLGLVEGEFNIFFKKIKIKNLFCKILF